MHSFVRLFRHSLVLLVHGVRAGEYPGLDADDERARAVKAIAVLAAAHGACEEAVGASIVEAGLDRVVCEVRALERRLVPRVLLLQPRRRHRVDQVRLVIQPFI